VRRRWFAVRARFVWTVDWRKRETDVSIGRRDSMQECVTQKDLSVMLFHVKPQSTAYLKSTG
jgi:hypothetical protein